MRCLLSAMVLVSVLIIPSLALAADYAPINCTKATTPADVAICKTYSLGQDEAQMATLYGIAMSLVAMGQRGDIGDAQLQWIKTREACGSNVACLTKAYGARIPQLNTVIDGIASHGPY